MQSNRRVMKHICHFRQLSSRRWRFHLVTPNVKHFRFTNVVCSYIGGDFDRYSKGGRWEVEGAIFRNGTTLLL